MRRLVSSLVFAALLAPVSAWAKTVRALLVVASSVGDSGEPVLRYARPDAERIADLFVEIGGVDSDRVYRVIDQPLGAVREKLAEVSGRLAEVQSGGNDAVLFVYISGHAGGGNLHLGGAHLPLNELKQFVESVPARLRVLIVDACESGKLVRWKGGTAAPEYDVNISQLPLEGQVVISSSGPEEPSQEWDSLGGSLFTHFLLSGLRGDADADQDGRVTLAEAYAHAFRRTVSQAAGTSQHPALDVDVAGSGELVVSEPGRGKAAILFPAASEGHYVITSQPRPDVLAEVDKSPGTPLRIAVPPGTYLIQKRDGVSVGLLSIELPYGGTGRVDESRLVKRHLGDVSLKGGLVDLFPNAGLVSGSVDVPPIDGTPVRWGFNLGYRRNVERWWAELDVGAGPSRFRGVALTVHEWDFSLAARGGYRFFAPVVTPYVGLGVELLTLGQSFTRDQEKALQNDRYPAAPSQWSAGISAGPTFGVELPLPAKWFALAWVDGWVRYLRVSGQPSLGLSARAQLALGYRF